MKHIRASFEDEEFKPISKLKDKLKKGQEKKTFSWRKFIIKVCKAYKK